MKKLKTLINFLVVLLVILIGNTFIVYAIDNIPTELIINTGNRVVGRVDYKNYTISAYKIMSKEKVGYCLDIDKEYPVGQLFKLKGDCRGDIENILIAGYPNRSAAQLNLESEDEAYFATQIVIWSAYEGYDVYKFSGANQRILDAIISIYENSKLADRQIMKYEGKEYQSDIYTQEVVMLFWKLEGVLPEPPVENPEPPIEPPTTPEENPEPPIEPPTTPEENPEPPIEPPTTPEENPEPPIEVPTTPEEDVMPELPQTGTQDYYNYMGIAGIVFITLGIYLLIRKPNIQ